MGTNPESAVRRGVGITASIALGGLLALALPAACRRSKAPEAAAERTRTFAVTGVVRGIDAKAREITLEHGPIEGFMDAMTMDYPARADASLLAGLAPGDRISATLVVRGSEFWLERIAKTAPAPAEAARPASPAGPATPRPNRAVPLGESIPDFTLTEAAGRPVRLSDFRGEPVAITFLYTRCPIATACPMTAAKFSKLDAMLARGGSGMLLTVTVDPEHDTPKVLADYAARIGADPKRWKFLTGDPKAVADVAERFGVLYYPDRGQVVHQQAVAVLDPRGKLSSIYYGENWEPEQILRDMEKARKG